MSEIHKSITTTCDNTASKLPTESLSYSIQINTTRPNGTIFLVVQSVRKYNRGREKLGYLTVDIAEPEKTDTKTP